MNRWQWILWLGGGVLGYVQGAMISHDTPATDSGSGAPVRRLSVDLDKLVAAATDAGLTIREIESILAGRGLEVLVLVLTLPFLLPSIPGLSTPLGIAVMFLGIRLAIGKSSWLPDFVLKRRISRGTLRRLAGVAAAIFRRLERITRPRLGFFSEVPAMIRLAAVGVSLGGLCLALPLPLPFSNNLPALSVLCLTLGMIERDGAMVLSGYLSGFVAWAYIAAVALLGEAGVRQLLPGI